MGLFDTLKKAAQTAGQLAETVQKLENAANSAQHLTNAQPTQKTKTAPAPAAAPAQAEQTKTVGHIDFPQNPDMPGSRELALEGWYCAEDGMDKELRYCFSCPPGFLPWETEALFAIAYVPDCKDEYAPEVLNGAPNIALYIDPTESAYYRRFLEDGTILFNSIDETGDSRMPHRSMCRIQGGRFILRAYHLNGILGTPENRENALVLCYASNLAGTQTEQMLWTALDQVAVTFEERPL